MDTPDKFLIKIMYTMPPMHQRRCMYFGNTPTYTGNMLLNMIGGECLQDEDNMADPAVVANLKLPDKLLKYNPKCYDSYDECKAAAAFLKNEIRRTFDQAGIGDVTVTSVIFKHIS